ALRDYTTLPSPNSAASQPRLPRPLPTTLLGCAPQNYPPIPLKFLRPAPLRPHILFLIVGCHRHPHLHIPCADLAEPSTFPANPPPRNLPRHCVPVAGRIVDKQRGTHKPSKLLQQCTSTKPETVRIGGLNASLQRRG